MPEKVNPNAMDVDEYNQMVDAQMYLMSKEQDRYDAKRLYESAFVARDMSEILKHHLSRSPDGRWIVKATFELPNPKDKTAPLKFTAGDAAEVLVNAFWESRPYLDPQAEVEQPDLQAAAFGPDREKAGLKAQGELIREFGLEGAKLIASRWGTSLGSTKPGTKPPAVPEKVSSVDYSNPWAIENPRDPKIMERRLSIIRTSTKMATAMAAKCGKRLDGKPLKKPLNAF
jgi:hypothetical protein